MSGAAVALPPFKATAAALRKTTEHLARQLVEPTESPPDWTEFEWAVARSVAAMHGTSFLLGCTLRWRGPPAWQSFLEQQREQAVLRNALLGRLLVRIDSAARDAGLGCVALKGSALRALGIYEPGARPMGDIDLLVRERDTEAAAAVLLDLGYRLTSVTDRETVFEPRHKSSPKGFGEHVDNPINIELHTAVAERLPARKLDITARLLPAQPHPGVNAYPTLAALLLHLLLHAAGNMCSHTLRQIQLHDIARLAGRLRSTDWEELAARPERAESPWWAYPPLCLTARYYGTAGVPPEVLRALRARCPRALRFTCDRESLTDVSWSNLRIPAFPGIDWSRTPADALRYIRSRVLPDRTALADIEGTRQRQPRLDAVPWYGISHGQRIARWLLTRPPRVQTILSVTAALQDRQAGDAR